MRRSKVTLLTSAILFVLVPLTLVRAAEWQSEWEAALKGAKKEGKLVLAIPPSAELRKELEPLLKQKFGIEAELIVSRGADSANRIASEYRAGVRTFDGLIQGTTTAMSLQDDGMLDPVSAYMISARGQRSQILVGRPYLERQHQDEPVSLFLCRQRWKRRSFLQRGTGKGGRIAFFRRSSESKMEGQDRLE